MGKPKLAVTEVFILEEVLPYEGSEIIGVFTTPEAAMETRPGRWKKVTNAPYAKGETFWTTKRDDGARPMHEFFHISNYPIRTK